MILTINPMGMGLISAQNDDIVLAGGIRSGRSGPGLTRCKYMIYCKNKWNAELERGTEPGDAQDASEVGFCELFVKDGGGDRLDVTGLVNIEINKDERRNGYARKVVDAIRHTTGNALEIHSIKKHYAATWRKLGVEKFHDGSGNDVKVSKHKGHLAGTMPPISLAKANTRKADAEEGLSM